MAYPVMLLADPLLDHDAKVVGMALYWMAGRDALYTWGMRHLAAVCGLERGTDAATEKAIQRPVTKLVQAELVARTSKSGVLACGRLVSGRPDAWCPPDVFRPPDGIRPPDRTEFVHPTGRNSSSRYGGLGVDMKLEPRFSPIPAPRENGHRHMTSKPDNEPADRPLTLVPPETTRPKRARSRTSRPIADDDSPTRWPPSEERHIALVSVFSALGKARKDAGMTGPHKPSSKLLRGEKTFIADKLLRCLADLEADEDVVAEVIELKGEPMTPLAAATALIIATLQAKVHEHAAKRGDDDWSIRARDGEYATIETMSRPSLFANWLVAGRAWLRRGGPPTTRPRGVVGSSYSQNNTADPTEAELDALEQQLLARGKS